ncbi:MAG: hypothetical protein CK528_06980 [Alcaligenaceae bacterium]|nr:MAG: hypothetical protein CK528_06980 [Alcaligenaceae bacterium]
MNVTYYKERFENTESAYLLARRANSPDLNPRALQAIEEIIAERGEVLPTLVPFVESATIAESKSDRFWRLTATFCACVGVIALLKVFTTGFVQVWAGSLVASACLLWWLRTDNIRFMKLDLWCFMRSSISVFMIKLMSFKSIRRTSSMVPVGAVVAAIALGYYVILPKIIVEDETTPRWYLHGLVYTKNFDELQEKLAPYKVRMISRGCIIDDDVYAKDIRHNQQVYESASPELKLLLGEPRPRI